MLNSYKINVIINIRAATGGLFIKQQLLPNYMLCTYVCSVDIFVHVTCRSCTLKLDL